MSRHHRRSPRTKRQRSTTPRAAEGLLGAAGSGIATAVPACSTPSCTLAAMCAEDGRSASGAHGATCALLSAGSEDACPASVCGSSGTVRSRSTSALTIRTCEGTHQAPPRSCRPAGVDGLAPNVGVDRSTVGAVAASVPAAVTALAKIGRREDQQARGRVCIAGFTSIHRGEVRVANRLVVVPRGLQAT
jgi:hypothetical protein